MDICIEKLDGIDSVTLALITDYITAYPNIPFEVAYKLAESENKNPTPTKKVEHYPGSEQDGMNTTAIGAEEGSEFETLQQGWEAVISSGSTNDSLMNLISQTKAFQSKRLHTLLHTERKTRPLGKESSMMRDLLRSLLESLCDRSFSTEDDLWLAYLKLLPCLLEEVAVDYAPMNTAQGPTDRLNYEQLWHAAEEWPNAREIVSPYRRGIIEPLEKELVFHFHPGLQTVQRSEPQHFFTFLLDLLCRVGNSEAVSAAFSPGLPGRVELVDFGQLRLGLTAEAILSETYQWNPLSTSFLSDTPFAYVVHFINTFLDFVEQAERRVYSQTLEFLSGRVLAPPAMRVYLARGNHMVEKALKCGTDALWRRPFLNPGIEALPFYLNTVHFVRGVDAFIQRLSGTFLHVDPSRGGGMVREFVESAIGTYVAFTEDHLSSWDESGNDDDDVNWNHVLEIQEVILSLFLVLTAAEGWLEMLKYPETKGSCEPPANCSAAASFEPFSKLVAHRDEQIHKCALEAERLVKLMSRPSEVHQPNLRDYEDLEVLLGHLYRVPYGFSLLALEAVIKEKFEECLTAKERESLQRHLSLFGLRHTSCLLG
ncbi:unnamed protein product [Phytomonas sp. Hart1]|nr:unnamed protein product [Phytomonas sp. Hart1]|eukprot:CCW66352.1 unnamed protein product [Phytomonas sp. isolate Hart1]